MSKNFLNFKEASGSLVIYLRNTNRVSSDVISRPFLNDILMTVNLIFSESFEEVSSIQVTKKFVEYWGVDEDVIFDTALTNTKLIKPKIERVYDVIMRLSDDIDFEDIGDVDDSVELFVISNYNNLNGAACILQSASLRYFCKKVNANGVIIIPSSIHECLLLPVRGDSFIKADDIDLIISEMNNTIISKDEILSYTSMMWDVKSGWL